MFQSIEQKISSLDFSKKEDVLEALSYMGITTELGSYSLLKNNNRDLFFNDYVLDKYREVILNEAYLENIILHAAKEGINLYEQEKWKSILDEAYEQAVSGTTMLKKLSTRSSYLEMLIVWKKDIDATSLFQKVFTIQKNSYYTSSLFDTISKILFERNPIDAKLIVDSEVFDSDEKPSTGIRHGLYNYYIKSGFLTKKKARKIRSETSEHVSASCLKTLIDVSNENPSLYPNINELIIQFSDTRYSDVQMTLAAYAPFGLICGFLGFTNPKAKNLIEKRMQDGK